MITRDQLLASMKHETRVIKHLATKVPAGQFDWRPTPKQRSTIELMRMQLFLYAKESGATDIGPANCWVGVDAPKQPAA